MRVLRYLCALLFLLTFYSSPPALSAPTQSAQEASAWSHFLSGHFELAQIQYQKLFTSTRNPHYEQMQIKCLMALKKYADAKDMLDKQVKVSLMSENGPWLEGYFLQAYLSDKLGENLEDTSALERLIHTGPHKNLSRILLSKQQMKKKEYKKVVETLSPILNSDHPLETQARTILRVALRELLYRDPAIEPFYRENETWLIKKEAPDKNLVQTSSSTNQEELNIKPLGTPYQVHTDLGLSASTKVIVKDMLKGVDPLQFRSRLVPTTEITLELKSRLFQYGNTEWGAGYEFHPTFHLASDLFDYDSLVHGLTIHQLSRFRINKTLNQIQIQNRILSGITNFTIFVPFLFANETSILWSLHISPRYTLGLEGYGIYQKYRDFTATGHGSASFTPQVLYSSGMTGLRFGGKIKNYLKFERSFFFGFPLESIFSAGIQSQSAKQSAFQRVSYSAEARFLIPLKWSLESEISTLFAFNSYSSSARGSEMFSESHLILAKKLTFETKLALDSAFDWRSGKSSYKYTDLNVLLRASYDY